jgi:predicted ATPase
MVSTPRTDLVLLHLLGRTETETGTGTTAWSDIPAICAALNVPSESVAERVGVLSALSELQERGLVTERTTADENGQRRAYALTDAGRARAVELRGRYESETVRIEDGDGSSAVPLSEIERYDGVGSFVRALARMSADGVLRVGGGDSDRFADREAALEILESALDAVSEGDGRTVLVTGEAGVGKTSLVREALATAREREFDVLDGKCARDANEPYGPFHEALAATDADPFGRSVGPAGDEGAFEAGRRALFDDVADALSADDPIACFVDDLHWADAGTLALFAFVADAVDGPFLLIGAYREEDLPAEHDLRTPDDWLGDVDPCVVDLSPFDRPATRTLIAGLLDVEAPRVPADFVAAVQERTGGNPLFVGELVGALRDEGRIDPARGLYPGADDASVPMPERIENAIAVRFDALDATAETVLETSAVIGPTIPLSVLASVLDLSEPDLREYVDVLVGARVWERVGDDGVRFVSDLVRETVLDRLDADERRDRHATVASALAGSDAAGAAAVAHHYERAGDDGQALEYYRRAGEDAMDVYAHEVAIENHEAALELARERDAEDTVHESLLSIGRSYYVRSDYDEAERHFEYVRERSDDEETVMEAVYFLASIDNDRGAYDRAIERARAGLDRWDGESPKEPACLLLSAEAWARKQTGDLDEALETARRERDLAEWFGDRTLEARALHDVATVELDRGDLDAALEKFEHAGEVFAAVEDPWRRSRALSNQGVVHGRRGDLDAATDAFERCRAIDASIGDAASVAADEMNLGVLAVKRGAWAAARDHLDAARDRATEVGDRENAALAAGNLGDLLLRLGDLDAARERLREALDGVETIGNDRNRAVFLLNRAAYRTLVDDLEGAREAAGTALDVATGIEAGNEIPTARGLLARVARVEGDAEAAIEHAEAGVEAARGRDAERTVEALRELALARLAAGRADGALETAEDGIDALDAVSDPWQRLRIERVHGVCLREAGGLDAAEERLDGALRSARSLDARIEECRGLLELGRLARERDDVATARARIETALSIAEETGAALYERWCRDELDAFDAAEER